MKTFVLNGWVASPGAWERCMFPRDRIFDYVEELDGIAREHFLAEKKSILVGWSMGGTMALKLALESPGKVGGLVLVSATARMMAANNWNGMTPNRLKALEYGFVHGMGEGPYAEDSPERMKRGLDFLEKTDLRMELVDLLSKGSLKCPVHIFQSEKDPVVRSSNASFLKAVFPEASLTVVPGAEHALPVAIPELIDAAVADCVLSA